ncbi:unnamed protein product [Rhizophagus irregularis]|nr:unnamed protein product [Rhizophagus irregularis]
MILPSIINDLDGIHKKHMIHHDFHTRNILLDERELLFENQKIFISDMGLCGEVGNTDETKLYGVVPYIAPEVLRGKPYTQAADIYSLDICEGVRPKINVPEAPQCLYRLDEMVLRFKSRK